MTVNSVGDHGGDQIASATLTGVAAGLTDLVANFDSANPNVQVGLIANRLGSLSYGQTDDLQLLSLHVSTVDLATGKDAYPNLRFSTSAPYGTLNASATDAVYFENLSSFYDQNALQRQAIAPMWEVQTAQLQTQNHLTGAGLSEVERAADRGQLASALPAGATTHDFNPIGLDLGGGLVTTALAQSGVQFDVDGTANLNAELLGQAVAHYEKNTAWLNRTDGFLVLDKNVNGTIDDGEEMFSNSEVAENARGIASLATVDANGDGIIDASDPVFSQLQVWRDANGDGQVEAGETVLLSSLGISSLNYKMGSFVRNGQTAQMSTLVLQASTSGNAYSPTTGGIAITNTDGKTTIAVTQIHDLSSLQADEDGPVPIKQDTAATLYAHGFTDKDGHHVDGLLDNDVISNAPNALLSIIGVENAQHGTVALDSATQTVTFTPDADYSGTDAGFDYDVSAGAYGHATAHVAVTVTHTDAAPHITGPGNTPLQPIYGYTFTPEHFEQFGTGDSESETFVPAAYTPFYAPGTGYADSAGNGYGYHSTPTEYPTEPYSGTVTATDADDPASSLTWSIVADGHNGHAQIDQHTGAWTFTNAQAIGGTDAFLVKVTDSTGLSDTIRITVPLPPVPIIPVEGGGGAGPGAGGGSASGDPIVLDLDGTGFHFQSLDNSNVFFQQADDGWRHRTAWFSGGNGVLAVDKFGDGIVHDSSQIELTSYSNTAHNDLQGLAAFDSNHDGVISHLDARWSQLGVWVDTNQDGVSEAGEYKSLDALGITSLGLTSDNQFAVNNGVTIDGLSSFTRSDGTTGQAADVTLPQSADILFTHTDGTSTVEQVAAASADGGINVGAGNNLVLGEAGDNHMPGRRNPRSPGRP